jgi:predicted dehydrogenase
MLRVGIIGCGRVTSMFHLKAIQQIDEFIVTALSDVNEDRMKKLKRTCSASSTYLDYKKMLLDPNVEAIVVNTPPSFHEDIVLDALKAGKHVLCEKPLAKTVEGCKKIKELQKETGLVVLPAHNYAFSPSLLEMNKFLKNGIVGETSSIEVSFENLLKSYRSKTNFRENIETGIVEDVLPHILSVLYPLVGHIEEVNNVNWWCKDYNVCDNMNVRLISNTGVPINASMSWTKLRPRFSVTLVGTKGSLYTDLMINPYRLDITVNGIITRWKKNGIKWYFDLVRFKHPSFKAQYIHFYQLVTEGCSPIISVDEEINILETMNWITKKMR